jgi:hypothetical protein
LEKAIRYPNLKRGAHEYGMDAIFRTMKKNRGWPAALTTTKSDKPNKSINMKKDYGLYAIFLN